MSELKLLLLECYWLFLCEKTLHLCQCFEDPKESPVYKWWSFNPEDILYVFVKARHKSNATILIPLAGTCPAIAVPLPTPRIVGASTQGPYMLDETYDTSAEDALNLCTQIHLLYHVYVLYYITYMHTMALHRGTLKQKRKKYTAILVVSFLPESRHNQSQHSHVYQNLCTKSKKSNVYIAHDNAGSWTWEGCTLANPQPMA